MGTGAEMGTQFFSCAMGCAKDENCVGITVSASSCQEHQADRDAAQYKRRVMHSNTFRLYNNVHVVQILIWLTIDEQLFRSGYYVTRLSLFGTSYLLLKFRKWTQ